jgi:ribonuclease HI
VNKISPGLKIDFSNSILVYCDGACLGNPGPGGWGAVIVDPNGHVFEAGGKDEATTNNAMELEASIRGIKQAVETIKAMSNSTPTMTVQILTDSTYVIRGITQWVWGWKKNGWQTAEGQPVSNREKWEKLSHLVWHLKSAQGVPIQWHYVRGHIGTPGNERVDQIASSFASGKYVELFDGPLLKYTVAIHDIPEDTSLPEMKPKGEKTPAFSYLSYYGGEVKRHSNWADCERRVKGRSGAKFKKANSAEDEKVILASWGLSPDIEIK